jgi:hypothetical protein
MRETVDFKTFDDIEKEMSLLQGGGHRPWGRIFLLLYSIEQCGYFQQSCASFTGWVEKNAWRLQKKPAMLWRIFSSGRFVRQLQERFKEGDFAVPSLEDLPDFVNPENVEILSKLDRVMPLEPFIEVARRVFAGEVTRSELRGTWETYRPVLGGKTARGRGVVAPRLDQKDPEQHQSLIQAATLDAFQTAGPAWLGIKSPEMYKVFVHVNPEGYRVPKGRYLFAAVVVVKPRNDSIQYHGIRFLNFARPQDSYDKSLVFCDRLWVFSHSASYGRREFGEHSTVPDGVGIIDVENGMVSMHKPARAIDGAGQDKIRLASMLLLRALATR